MAQQYTFDCTLTEQLSTVKSQEKVDDTCAPKNILIVGGSKDDRILAPSHTALLERVWILSRPPQNLGDLLPTVSARRLQIVRMILDGEFQEPKCPIAVPCKEDSTPKGSARSSEKSVSIIGV